VVVGGRGLGLYVTEAGQEMARSPWPKSRRPTRVCELLGEERSTALTELLRESRTILRKAN
jgi:hypothetical protein